MKFLYCCFTFAYAVPLSVYLFWRRWVKGEPDLERLGRSLPNLSNSTTEKQEKPFWLVASSVGEVTVALRLIAALKEHDLPAIVSVTTPAGRARAVNAASPPAAVFYHPLDRSRYVRRVLAHFRPRAVLLIETELWPVLIETCAEHQVPVLQVSGSISPGSFRRYRALKPFFGKVLSSCRALLMQTRQDEEFATILTDGRPEITVAGSLKEKYSPPPPEKLEKCRRFFANWSGKRIWSCGSTRPGEEVMILRTFRELQHEHPELRLVVAPRHLDRMKEVAQLLLQSEIEFELWSESEQVSENTSAVLIDEIGWLNATYHISQLAFVGGTLVPIGGHNLLEPAFAGLPVIYGPFYDEQQLGHELLAEYQLGHVTSEKNLTTTVSQILSSLTQDSPYRERALRLRQRGSGMVATYVDKILSAIGGDAQ